MERETELLHAIEKAEANLTYRLVFRQETGEEAVVYDMTLAEASERYPEWLYSHREMVQDHYYSEWDSAWREYRFWKDTKDMDDEEYDAYLDSMGGYDYELDDCYDY
jgi:hypothetical protein